MNMRATFVILIAIGTLGCNTSARAQLQVEAAPALPEVSAAWQALANADLSFLAASIKRNYIYANYNAGSEWVKLSDDALAQARKDAALVRNFGSYRAVITRYLASFGDPHLSAYFQVNSVGNRWPGFSVKYAGGKYVVDHSRRKDVVAGAEITSCDGRPMVQWVDGLTKYFGGPAGRETTRATVAQQFLVDTNNPYYSLPKSCRVGGSDLTLSWSSIPDDVTINIPTRTGESPSTLRDGSLTMTDFGADGAWVRMGTMLPSTQSEAAAFQSLIDRAPTIRNKRNVVIDVRGNRGGNYNWFMAFLRSFYGQPYADYFGRARLEIAPVMMTPAGERNDPNTGFTSDAAAIKIPADPPLKMDAPKISTLPSGAQLVQIAAPVKAITYAATAPASEARARVYVLTDYGCASACLSFIDEMMRFPGVTLLGSETHIDRRAGGFPLGYTAPSGLVVARMGRMVRDGRARGENEAWAPGQSNRFPGDIADTEGVKLWITTDILPRDEARGARWRQTATLKGAE